MQSSKDISRSLVCLKNKMKMKSKFVKNIREKCGGYSSDSSSSAELYIIDEKDEVNCKEIKTNYNQNIYENEEESEEEDNDELNTAFSADLDRTHIFPLALALIELTQERVENLYF